MGIAVRRYLFLYVAAFSAAIISAGMAYWSADILGVSVKILTRDPYRAARVPPYFAYFSLVTSSIWLIAGTTTLTTALIARKALGCRISDVSAYRMILLGGIIGTIMALDDILLFHDAVADQLGIPELLFHLFYSLLLLSLIVHSRNLFKSTPWLIFVSSLACFALSSAIDLIRSSSEIVSESEDVFKLCAVILWASYFLYVSWDLVAKYDS